ncbi:MAG TPA: ATP-binding protein [Patescibacteria group bacterium]|nr:ATP-binding protein [Patescibacteria group bacterium]
MLLVNLLLTFSILTGVLLGLFIYASNTRKPVNRALSFFLFSIALWLASNLFTNLSADPRQALWFARTTLIGGSLIPLAFVIFCKIYTRQTPFTRSDAALLSVTPATIISTLATRLNIVSIQAYGKETATGAIYFLLVPMAIAYFVWGLSMLIRYYRYTKKPIERAQLRYIFAGIILAFVPIVVANGILPSFGNNVGILYAPNAAVLLAIFMAIAIVKHRLLDIRLIVARSLAYALVLSTAVALYALLTFDIAVHLFGENQFSQRVVPIAMAIFLAFTIQPLRRFFARITNTYFYRDAYDTQVFLNEFNNVLVSTYDLEVLLERSAGVIQENLKPLYCMFVIATGNASPRVLGTPGHPAFNERDAKLIRGIAPNMKREPIVADFLEDSQERLQKALQSNDIAILARLSVDASGKEAELGYLLLGRKKSGNLYSGQDVKVVEIIVSELVIAIQNALRFEEIENFNATLQEKIDDATRKLRRVNDKLRHLNETKDDFISMASHQLRTPLTSVKGYVSMVLDGDAGKITSLQRRLLTQSFVSSQRMVYLISDLLNVSRLKTGKFIIEPIPCNLVKVVQEEVDQLVETAKSRHLVLEYYKPEHFPTFMLDETKLRQVIMNFLDNAVYYTPAGGKIEVHLVDKPQTIEFTVTDNGIGVPRHEQHHLFSKFFRAPNAKRARPDGTGLGLFMAKKVIIAQGGAVIFKSHEGKGSTFGFTFAKSHISVRSSTVNADQKSIDIK